MIRKIIIFLVMVICSLNLSASQYPVIAVSLVNGGVVRWTPFQGGVYPFYIFAPSTNSYGLNLNLGANFTLDKSVGINIAPWNALGLETYALTIGGYNSLNGNNYGISAGLVNTSENNYGMQLGIVNVVKDFFNNSTNYVQAGIYNQADSGLQIGLLNHNKNSILPWMILFNFSLVD